MKGCTLKHIVHVGRIVCTNKCWHVLDIAIDILQSRTAIDDVIIDMVYRLWHRKALGHQRFWQYDMTESTLSERILINDAQSRRQRHIGQSRVIAERVVSYTQHRVWHHQVVKRGTLIESIITNRCQRALAYPLDSFQLGTSIVSIIS